MKLQRPRITPVLLQWDLCIVLEALSKPPYKPLREASEASDIEDSLPSSHALVFDLTYIQFKPKGACRCHSLF